MTVPPSRPYEEADIIRGLREDPEYAAAYLELVLNEGSEDEIALVRRRIAAAFGDDFNLLSMAAMPANVAGKIPTS